MSLLPKAYLNTVVSIEKFNEQTKEYPTVATGFLIGLPIGLKNDKGEDYFRIFLVTNKHVLEGQDIVYLRFNKGSESRRYDLPLKDSNQLLWSGHTNPAIDIAVIPILANKLEEDGVEFQWITQDLMATIDIINTLGITQGDEVFVLGFPLGLSGKIKKYAIVRSGIIARLDNDIINEENCFLIDSTIFPGNSGGPVFLKPASISIEGTTPVTKPYLLGVISGYLRYQDVAFSTTTFPPEPRIVFNENTGLARVVPLDAVLELAKSLLPTKEQLSTAEKLELGVGRHNEKGAETD